MTIASKLTALDGVKTDIKAALEGKGVDTTSMPFTDYADAITDLETGGGSGDGSWTRPTGWPDVEAWVSGGSNRVGILVRVTNSANGNSTQVQMSTSSGTWSVDWGDGVTESAISSATNKTKSYTYADTDLIDLSGTLGYKLAFIKVTADSANFTSFSTQGSSISGSPISPIVEINANTASATTFTWCGTSHRMYRVESMKAIVSTASLPSFPDNIVYGTLRRFELSGSFTTTPALNCLSLEYIKITSTATGAMTINALTHDNGSFSGATKYIELNLATNSNFSLATKFRYTSVKEIKITNSGSGLVSSLNNTFVNCSGLRKLTVPGLTSTCDLSQSFDRCSSLEEFVGFGYSVSNTGMTATFRSCNKLPPLTGFTVTGSAIATFQQSASIEEIPAWNWSGLTSYTSTFENMLGLRRMQATLPNNVSVSFASCNLDATALNEVYTNLPTASGSPTITVSGNPGTGGDTPSIATGKGWTVSGS